MTLLAEGRPEGISKLPLSLSCEVELEVGLVSPAPLSHAAQPTLSVFFLECVEGRWKMPTPDSFRRCCLPEASAMQLLGCSLVDGRAVVEVVKEGGSHPPQHPVGP
jgi:hypothetical protein